MRRFGILFLAVPLSTTIAHAQYPFAQGNVNSATMEASSKALGCNVVANNALNSLGGYYSSANVPFSIVDGKVNVFDQDRVISKKTEGDTETIEYKANQITGYKNGQGVLEMVRQTVVIKRQNGKIVSISHPQDLRRSAAQREEAKKLLGNEFTNYDLLKTTETTFRETSDGRCETNQKEFVLAKDEKGKISDTLVTYDAALCDKLQPAISKIGKNNAKECGPLLATAERLIGERTQSLKADGKTLTLSYGTAKDNSTSMSLYSVSTAIAGCLAEDQLSSGNIMAGMGSGMGFVGAYTIHKSETRKATNSDSTKKVDVNPATR